MKNFYDIQPESCRMPLPAKDYTGMWWFDNYSVKYPYVERVLSYDPTEAYDILVNGGHKSRYKNAKQLSPYNRQNIIACQWIFPSIEGLCSCGCGQELKGRQRRWASEHCGRFASDVTRILAGDSEVVKNYVAKYHFEYAYHLACQKCGDAESSVEFDHIVPVHQGGGLCWLSNYQVLCIDCHKTKTKLQGKLKNTIPLIAEPKPIERKSIFGFQ